MAAREKPQREAAPAAGDSDIREMLAKMQEQIGQLQQQNKTLADANTNLQTRLALERPATLPAALAQDREEWFKKFAADRGRSCGEQTQEQAFRLWGKDSPKLFNVAVRNTKSNGAKPGLLDLVIPAHDEEGAKGRYDKLCGIRSVDADMEYVITENEDADAWPQDIKAQKAAVAA